MLLGMVISWLFTRSMVNIRKNQLVYTDKRSKLLVDYLNGIRLIKFYGWEKMCLREIDKGS